MSDNNQTYKADSGKTRLDLVSPTFIEAVGKIRTFGVQKYGDSDNWAKVEPKRYMAALLRHINAYRMGEDTDKESGMPHLWHAACNLMFLIDLDELKAVSFGESDTPPKENKCCLNCLLFCECVDYHTKRVVNGYCDKWQSDRVEETKAAISALHYMPQEETENKAQHSCKDCEYCTYCDGIYSCSLYGILPTTSVKCGNWQDKF